MNVWEFLKRRMLRYGEQIAFSEGKITYGTLITLAENGEAGQRNVPIIAKGATRQEQAIKILRIMAGGNIPVPVEVSYGAEREEKIKTILAKNRDKLHKTAAILFTSGTTGEPKGVKLSHRGIIENLKGIDGYFQVREGQKILIARPLVHVAVFTGEFLFALYKGLEIDFYEEAFQPARLAKYIDENEVQVFGCTPTLLYHLSRHLQGKSLDSIVISGERLTEGVANIVKEKFPDKKFYNVYGLTENSSRVSALCPEEFFDNIGSVGKPIAHTKVKLEDGELLVKSRSLMQGYIDEREKTKEKLKKGWLHTGDMASIDGQRYLYILGRKDDLLIRSGMNIYPAEIESVALQIDGVKNCMVYGEEDIHYGQKICMKVVADLGVAALRKELIDRLPAYLIPDKILLVESLELTPSGKVKRK